MRHGLSHVGQGMEFGNFNPNFIRAFDQMLPGEGAGPLSRELVEQRNRVMVIEENEMSADGEINPGLDDQSMLDRTGNGPDIHNVVGADEVCVLGGSIHV